MSLTFSTPPKKDISLTPRIVVVGVGGGGCNAVNSMIEAGVSGVEFVVANTDNQALTTSICKNQIQLGVSITSGLGAGSEPEIGRKSCEESLDEILRYIDSAHMVFVTAGMGGGTGTGGAPVVAKAAKERGILTVGVVTKPFEFEQRKRMETANSGVRLMEEACDTLIVIPNQNLFRIANENTLFSDAFRAADQVLVSGVRCNTDLITTAGIINLDFADVSTIMSSMGRAVMGEGYATGEGRALKAAEAAITNPLLEYSSITGATGALINIAGGSDMTLFEVNDAIKRITEEIDLNANMKFGSVVRKDLEGAIQVTVVATGISTSETLDTSANAYELPPKQRLQNAEEVVDVGSARNSVSTRRMVEEVYGSIRRGEQDNADDSEFEASLQMGGMGKPKTYSRPIASLPDSVRGMSAGDSGRRDEDVFDDTMSSDDIMSDFEFSGVSSSGVRSGSAMGDSDMGFDRESQVFIPRKPEGIPKRTPVQSFAGGMSKGSRAEPGDLGGDSVSSYIESEEVEKSGFFSLFRKKK